MKFTRVLSAEEVGVDFERSRPDWRRAEVGGVGVEVGVDFERGRSDWRRAEVEGVGVEVGVLSVAEEIGVDFERSRLDWRAEVGGVGVEVEGEATALRLAGFLTTSRKS